MSKTCVNWRLYERNNIYPQSLSPYLELVNLSQSKKYPYIANHHEVLTFQDGYLWWARDADAIEKDARRWVRDWLYSKSELKDLLILFDCLGHSNQNILPSLAKIKVKNIGSDELYGLYEKTKNIFLSGVIFDEYAIDLFDDFSGNIFSEKIRGYTKGLISQEDIRQLLRPASITKSLQYRKKLLEFSFVKNVLPSELQKIANQFCWIAMGWDGSNELTVAKLKSDLAKLKKVSINDRTKELKKIKNFGQSVRLERKRILKKYKLPQKKLKPLFYLLDIFVVFHDRRKEHQMNCNKIIFPVLKEIAKRFKVDYGDLLFYFNSDIKNLCLDRKKLSASEIKKRKNGITWVISDRKARIFLGLRAKKVLNMLVLSSFKADNVLEISGETASGGKVNGKVFVTKSSKLALKNFKKGDILVTTMTTVDYLPVMKLASAIVTDDGGLTCHAAIISRELGIPCVVATKIATQIFKTGDRVEVDADQGVIKKLT